MPEIVCLGELLIDFVSPAADVTLAEAPGFQKAPGGAPANVAAGVAKLGVSAGFIGKVGADAFGEFLRRTLKETGVDVTHLGASEARTTLAFVATRSDGKKDILFYRNPGADQMLAPEDLDRQYIAKSRIFHFGSVSMSKSPSCEATLHAAQMAKEAGVLVSYDPNLRPMLWDDMKRCYKLIWEGMKYADIAKLAEEEWDFITDGASFAEGSARILDRGAKLVVITRGEKGCYFTNGTVTGELPALPVTVVDPLGAGDGFVAALLKRFLPVRDVAGVDEEFLQEAARFANAAGALTTQKVGVIPALPTAAELDAFVAEAGQ